MKKLLTTLLLASAITLPAAAYTVDEIMENSGGYALAIYQPYGICGGLHPEDVYGLAYTGFHLKQNIPISYSEGLEIEKIDDTKIKIKGFDDKELSFVFHLTDINGNETDNGSYLTCRMEDVPEDNPDWRIIRKTSSVYMDYYYDESISEYNITYWDSWTLLIKENPTIPGKLMLTSQFKGSGETRVNDHPMMYSNARPGMGNPEWDLHANQRAYKQVNIEFYTPNAEATDNLRTYDAYQNANISSKLELPERDRRYRQYPLLVEFEDGNKIKFTNFGNNGYGYYFSKSFENDKDAGLFRIGATLNDDNTIVFDKKQYARTMSFWYWGTRNYTGTDGKVRQDTIYTHFYEPLCLLEGFYHEDATENEGVCRDELLGEYTPLTLAHNQALYSWVETKDPNRTPNRGKRKTFEDFRIHVYPYTYYFNGLLDDVANFYNGYFDTDIRGNNDVTLNVELELENLQWHNRDGVYVTGSIKTKDQTDKYVESYDVMLVKGWFDHIEQDDFKPHNDNGHENAVVLCNGPEDAFNEWSRPKGAAALDNDEGGEHDYRFAKLITPAELGHAPEDGKYTVFIRANYKVEGLAPTFHSLNYIQNPIHTAVDDLISEGGAPVVKTIAGGIEVSGTEGRVDVVDMTGRTVYSGKAGNIELPAGIYVVRVGSYTVKTAVR